METYLRVGFTSAATGVLLVAALPPLRRRFVGYGKTAPPRRTGSLLDWAANQTVPHAWFAHFYLTAILASVFWGIQIARHGGAYRLVASYAEGRGEKGGMGIHQVVIVWLAFLAQGVRRLNECWYMMKPGTSRMWIGHYVVGIVFYLVMSVAIWIEGTGELRRGRVVGVDADGETAAIDAFDFNYWSLRSLLGPPSSKSWIGVFAFIFASGAQHDAHAHLASLKKYSLPDHPLFARVVAPHYTMELVIYGALMVLAAPRGLAVNLTIWSALVFVTSLLGVSAMLSRQWYAEKFGQDSVAMKWNLIVGLF